MDFEDRILRRYGLKRKREIWRAQTILRDFRGQARSLLTRSGPQAELEARQLFDRLRKFGLVGEDTTLDDVLGLTVDKVIERFLQCVVHSRGLARTPKQARQLIVHGHVSIGGRRVRSPTYMVPLAEESLISVAQPVVSQTPAEGEEAKAAESE
jgi:small subunit ribosomal protein S4